MKWIKEPINTTYVKCIVLHCNCYTDCPEFVMCGCPSEIFGPGPSGCAVEPGPGTAVIQRI